MTQGELLASLRAVTSVLDRLEVEYAVGGSVASSIYGEPRLTRDADIVALLKNWHVGAFVRDLERDFYVSAAMIAEAIGLRRSFNVINLRTGAKIDVFCAEPGRWVSFQLRRRQRIALGAGPDDAVFVLSPEDVVLSKLSWFRRGGEVSEQQWRDVQGVLRLRGTELHFDYMAERAVELGIADLLARARTEAGLGTA